jgi:hypothetical protein
MNKLIINHDVLLRTPITQVRRHIDDKRPEDIAKHRRYIRTKKELGKMC